MLTVGRYMVVATDRICEGPKAAMGYLNMEGHARISADGFASVAFPVSVLDTESYPNVEVYRTDGTAATGGARA
jgi:hypothetical protein